MTKLEVVNTDYLNVVANVDTIFADPFDNISLGYDEYEDNMPEFEYIEWLRAMFFRLVNLADTTFVSFNARWMTPVGCILDDLLKWRPELHVKWLVQGFTFGQHNKNDHGNNFRPIIRIMGPDAKLYPDAVRVESWRMKNGDKRANPNGKVPGDVWFSDFLDYARVTGNSKQRRKWNPTQLHEGLVEDCLLMTTPSGGTVFDPFAGTGTTLRVCKANGWSCITSDISRNYCERIAVEHELQQVQENRWSN